MFISTITGIEITLFYVVYFIKQAVMRKQGIQTNRLGKGKKEKQTTIIEKRLLVATYMTAIVQYVSLFRLKWFVLFDLPFWLRWCGVVLTGIGVFFFVSAIWIMKDSWRAGVDLDKKTTIVTSGIYRFSRNPAFVGFDFLYIGTFFAVPNLIMLLFMFFAVYCIHQQIKEEEKYLPTLFGEDYKNYQKRTARYLF